MKRKRWQTAAIDAKLLLLRKKHADPETAHVAESDEQGPFNQEMLSWANGPGQSWLFPDTQAIVDHIRRDNVERHKPRLDEGDNLICDPQMVLPLDLEQSITVRAENARLADWNDFIHSRQIKVDEHVDSHGRIKSAVEREKADYVSMNERWIDVQKRRGK